MARMSPDEPTTTTTALLLSSTYVPLVQSLANDAQAIPIKVTPTGDSSAGYNLLVFSAARYNGRVDALTGLGFTSATFVSTLQQEADWDTASTFTANQNGTTTLSGIVVAAGNAFPVVGGTLAGAGITGGTTVASRNVGAGTLVMSAVATQTATGVALTGTNVRIAESYFQVVDTARANTSMRPFYWKYDRTNHRATDFSVTIGPGKDDSGRDSAGSPAGSTDGFWVGWDDGSNAQGYFMFQVKPNRVHAYATARGPIAAAENRLNLWSSTGQGSAISMTYNGQDAEGTANPTFLLYTVGAGQTQIYSGGGFAGAWLTCSATAAPLQLHGGIKLGDHTNGALGTVWYCTGVPAAGLGNNGDVVFRTDGGAGTTLYQKRGGSWVATAA